MRTVKKGKLVAAGVSKKSPKAGPVDPNGAYTKVQQRTLGNMKKGGKIKKAQTGVTQEFYNPRDKDSTTRRTVVADTSGYSTGAKKFPTTTTTARGTSSGTASRKQVNKMIKNPRMGAYGVTPKGKTGTKMSKKK